uniref:Uncharacterized protein n=1 Tax=Oryza punctata TaxID=4537 RepID=A0A0E0MMA8_ORYPU
MALRVSVSESEKGMYSTLLVVKEMRLPAKPNEQKGRQDQDYLKEKSKVIRVKSPMEEEEDGTLAVDSSGRRVVRTREKEDDTPTVEVKALLRASLSYAEQRLRQQGGGIHLGQEQQPAIAPRTMVNDVGAFMQSLFELKTNILTLEPLENTSIRKP